MFWDNFYRLCKDKGISPSVVADTLGVGRASTTKWKNGALPRGETLQKLADYFGVTVDALLGNEKTPSEEGEKDGKDVVVVFRGGERIVQHVTPEQAALIDNLLKQFDQKQSGT